MAPWANGKNGKEYRSTMGRKAIVGIFNVGLEGKYRWKDSVQSADELRLWSARPDHLTTVLAGGDIEATERVREKLCDYPPASPSIALVKGGSLVHFVPRFQIESRDANQISTHLREVFSEHCSSGQTAQPA